MSQIAAKLLNKPVCNKCCLTIKSKDYMSCATCKNSLHLKCANVTTKKCNAMTKFQKSHWKCNKCTKNDQQPASCSRSSRSSSHGLNDESSSSTKLERNNIICRQPSNEKSYHHSMENLSYESAQDSLELSLCNLSRNSLPELSTIENTQIMELRQEIADLSHQLESAHEEVTKLNIENSELKKIIEEDKKKIKIYKQLLQEGPPSTSSTPKTSKKPNLVTLSSVETLTGNNDDGNLTIRSNTEVVPDLVNPTYIEKLRADTNNSNKCSNTNMDTKPEDNISIISPNTMTDVLKNNSPVPSVAFSPSKENPIDVHCGKNSMEKPNKKIYIIGSQQCKNLASTLKQSRLNSPYEKYEVEAFIKPGATTDDILKSCTLYNFTKEDKIIISVGENDTDPMEISAGLFSTLKSLPNPHIIIISVQYSNFLNEYKINQMLQLISKKFSNCTYLDVNTNIYPENALYICKKINLVIDQMYYDNQFLNFKNNMFYIKAKNRETMQPNTKKQELSAKRGTIPFYFKKLEHKNGSSLKIPLVSVEDNANVDQSTSIYDNPQNFRPFKKHE